MTNFEKIDSELTRLGWKKEKGRGDHFKYRKGDKFIDVAQSLPSNNRSYDNLLAEIRRKEPLSTLGRPAISKKKQRMNEVAEGISNLTETEKAVRKFYIFIYPSASVRYTTPEKGDFSKLSDPNSVMNQEYEVVSIDTGHTYVREHQDPVTIRHKSDGHEIKVTAKELTSWSLFKCDHCGSTLPECYKIPQQIIESIKDNCDFPFKKYSGTIQRIRTYQNICPECSKEIRSAIDDIYEEMDETPSASEILKSRDLKTGLKYSTIDELKAYGDNYDVESLPLKLQMEIAMARMFSEVSAASAGKQKKERKPVKSTNPDSLHEKWKSLLDLWINFEDSPAPASIVKSTYYAGKLTNKKSPDKTMPLLKFNVPDRDCAEYMTQAVKELDFLMESSGKSDGIIEIVCLAENFDEFITPSEKCSRKYKELQGYLTKKDYENKCHFLKFISEMPSLEEVKNIWERKVRTMLMKCEPEFDTEDVEVNAFASSNLNRTQFSLGIIFMTENSRNLELLRTPVVAKVIAREFMRHTNFSGNCSLGLKDNYNMDVVTDMEIIYSSENDDEIRSSSDNRTLHDILTRYLDNGRATLLDKILETTELSTIEFTTMILSTALEDFSEESGQKDKHSKPKEMKDTEKTQAGILQNIDTMELLKELKNRGVEMTGVKIPVVVKQEIDFNEI